MTEFNDNKDTKHIPTMEESNNCINTCVVGITSNHPYDTSIFVNNSTTFYTKITYFELIKLYNLIDLDTKESFSNKYDLNQIDLNESVTNIPTNMNIIYVVDCFKNPSIKMIFRFLCSPDCHDGLNFIDQETTNKIYDFVKLVTRRNCIIEVSDHSMGSFFRNWDNESLRAIGHLTFFTTLYRV